MKQSHSAAPYLLALTLLATLSVAVVGAVTDLSLGDEVYQYRFAKLWYETGKRPLYDPLLETSEQCLYYFDSDPLWAIGLIGLWKITGGVSRTIMQFYHAAWYGGLLLSVYLLGKKLYSEKAGKYAAVIAAGVPFLVAYSVMGYLDVPMVMLVTLSFLLVAERRYFWAGVAAGLAFITKRNSWLFIAPFGLYFLWLLWRRQMNWGQFVAFVLPAGLLSVPELIYRYFAWGSIFSYPVCNAEVARMALEAKALSAAEVRSLFAASSSALPISDPKFYFQATEWSWTPSNILYNPLSLPQYLGLVLLALLVAYFVFRRQKRRDLFLGWPVLAYLVQFFIFFYSQLAVRYLAPVFGLLAVFAGLGFGAMLERVKNAQWARWLQWGLTVACLLQFAGSLGYTYLERRLPAGVEEGYSYIRTQLPEDARILYPEYSLSEKTGRAMIWIRLQELPYLFWKADAAESQFLYKKYGVTHIMVKKSRIYDDTNVKHRLGYPLTYMHKLNEFMFLDKIFENDQVEIWRIKYSQ